MQRTVAFRFAGSEPMRFLPVLHIRTWIWWK